eukprot:gene16463-biopygen3778
MRFYVVSAIFFISAPHQALALMWCCSSFGEGWNWGELSHAPVPARGGRRGGVRRGAVRARHARAVRRRSRLRPHVPPDAFGAFGRRVFIWQSGHGPAPLWKDLNPVFPKTCWTMPSPAYEHRPQRDRTP